MKCTASSPRSSHDRLNAARRALFGITAPLVNRRSPAPKLPCGLSSSVENATRYRSTLKISTASSPRSSFTSNSFSSSAFRAQTTHPGPSKSPSEMIGLPSAGSGPWVTKSSSVEKAIPWQFLSPSGPIWPAAESATRAAAATSSNTVALAIRLMFSSLLWPRSHLRATRLIDIRKVHVIPGHKECRGADE